MQYILSQEELNELKDTKAKAIQMEKDELQKLCTKIADTMPIKYWGHDNAEPWGCAIGRDHYCDECPVQKICPREYKDYSQ